MKGTVSINESDAIKALERIKYLNSKVAILEGNCDRLKEKNAALEAIEKDHIKRINRCAEVEQYLLDAARGKHELPDAAKCRQLGNRIGDEKTIAIRNAWALDSGRIDYLEDFLKTGLISAGFEIDGGVYFDYTVFGNDEVSLRDQNTLRFAIDKARSQT
jgi:hypothetical protein